MILTSIQLITKAMFKQEIFLIGFSIINHPFGGTIIFGNTHILSSSKMGEALVKSSVFWGVALRTNLETQRKDHSHYSFLLNFQGITLPETNIAPKNG